MSRRKRSLGTVDYTLAKRSLLRDFRKGLLSLFDLCDAHPELMRAARNVGEPTTKPCPVCDANGLRLLAYVYSEELSKDENGRVWQLDKALTLAAACADGACYVVEVCTDCSWNHLSEAFMARTAG